MTIRLKKTFYIKIASLFLIAVSLGPIKHCLHARTVGLKKLKKSLLKEMLVCDFSLHPDKKTIITYLHKSYAEIFDIKKTKSILKIRNLDQSDMLSCQWLSFDGQKKKQTYLSIGFKSGKLVLLHITLGEKPNYKIIQQYDLKQPINSIQTNHTASPFGISFWSVTVGETQRFNKQSSAYFFMKNMLFNGFRLQNSIFLRSSLHGFTQPKNLLFSALAWHRYNHNKHVTVINRFFKNKIEPIVILEGKYKGFDYAPLRKHIIATGQHCVADNKKAEVKMFNLTTGELTCSFPVHVAGAGVNDLAFNKADPNILAVGYGGSVDIWDVSPNSRPKRVGYVQPQSMTVKKVFWWQPNSSLTWFFVLYQEGHLLGWEIEHGDNTKQCWS